MCEQYCNISKYGNDGRRDKWVQGVHTCPKARQVFYATMRKKGIDYRLHSELMELLHSRSKCFECDEPPTVDILWANGKGRCWFCSKHFEEWKKKKNDMSDTGTNEGDINKVYKVKDGEVPERWRDWNSKIESDDVDPLKPQIFPEAVETYIKDIKALSNSELEYYHALSHSNKPELFSDWCKIHWKVSTEMLRRDYPYMFRENSHCDRIVEWTIKDWKTYRPKNVNDSVLRDDWRIVNAWWKNILAKGQKMKSKQFENFNLERQKEIVKSLMTSIRKEMVHRGWEPQKLIELPQEKSDPHTEKTEPEVTEYPSPKGFPAKKQSLSWEEISEKGYITIGDVLGSLPDQMIVRDTREKPMSIYLVGEIVNHKRIPINNNVDILFKADNIDPKLMSNFQSSLPDWLSERINPVINKDGPQTEHSLLIYEPGNIFLHPPRISDSITLGKAFVGLKAKSGFHKYEFWDINEAYNKAVSQYMNKGLIVDKKYDGRRFHIHYDKLKNIFKIITEDRQRDRSEALPFLSKEIKSFLENKEIRNVILDSEAVAYNCRGKSVKDKEELCDFIDRENTVWLNDGPVSQEQEESVVFHIHDILYLNDKATNELGYSDRQKLFNTLIGEGTTHLKSVESTKVCNIKEFVSAVERMRSSHGSEGVIVKLSDSKYRIKYSGENRTGEWIKIKNLKELDVMVWDRVPVKKKGTGELTGAFRYLSLFEIPEQEKNKFRPNDVIEYQGKTYVKIGLTYATNERNQRGDIINVRQVRVRKNLDKDGKVFYTWMFPYYAGKRTDKKEPDTLTIVDRLERIGTKPLERKSLEIWYNNLFQEQLTCHGILSTITDEKLEDYLDNDNVTIALKKCPFFEKEKLCPFKSKFEGVYLTRVLEEDLELSVDCRFTDMFLCGYLKKYYYPHNVIEV